MTLSQLEYIIAVDKFKHFGKAADYSYISQPNLSLQIQKLEDELKVAIFNRHTTPISTTPIGALIIDQAKKICDETGQIKAIVGNQKKIAEGHLSIGIIPTLAPYLLPLFINDFIEKNPKITLTIKEQTTEKIIKDLKNGILDAGLMATPLGEDELLEDWLFYEEFIAFVSSKESLFDKSYILPADIDLQKVWLLEEGHCLRTQVLNLCELQKKAIFEKHVSYQTGSLDTLMRIVERNEGITLLPELATIGMNECRLEMLRYFQSPSPAREISIVFKRNFSKKRLIDKIKESIFENLPIQIIKKKEIMAMAVI